MTNQERIKQAAAYHCHTPVTGENLEQLLTRWQAEDATMLSQHRAGRIVGNAADRLYPWADAHPRLYMTGIIGGCLLFWAFLIVGASLPGMF